MPVINLKKQQSLSAERLRKLVHYDAETGEFTRKAMRFDRRPFGTISRWGYRVAWIDGSLFMVHRLAWLYVHGEWPAYILDHINRNRVDNRIANLREADDVQSNVNRRARGGRAHKGITWQHGRWQAQIRHGGKNLYLGRFDTADEAAAVYAAKALEFHGKFAEAQP